MAKSKIEALAFTISPWRQFNDFEKEQPIAIAPSEVLPRPIAAASVIQNGSRHSAARGAEADRTIWMLAKRTEWRIGEPQTQHLVAFIGAVAEEEPAPAMFEQGGIKEARAARHIERTAVLETVRGELE